MHKSFATKIRQLEHPSSVQFSCSVVPDSLWLHESQHIRPPCPSPTPRVHPWLKNVKKQTTATHGLFPAPRGSVGPEILSSGWERRGLEEKSLIPMSIELVMPSNHLILCHPLLLLPSIFPSLRVLPDESTLQIRWPKYWSFSFSISPSSEHPGLISFRMTGWISLQSKGHSRIFSNTTVQKHQFSVLNFPYSPTLTSIHDQWKNHSLDQMDLC